MKAIRRALPNSLLAVLLFTACNSANRETKVALDGSIPNLPDSALPPDAYVPAPDTKPSSFSDLAPDTTPTSTSDLAPDTIKLSPDTRPPDVIAVTKTDVLPAGPEVGADVITITEAGTTKGSTEFVAEEPKSTTTTRAADASVSTGIGGSSGAGGATSAAPPPAAASPAAPPSGRVAEVEEADIYKIDGNRLFYFNTYRGFLTFDITDPKNPKQVSRLPVFGYPIEMFVSGTTVYALIRDALYLTQVNGKPQFERYNVSQLVAIDISDVANPKILQTTDIIGQLREGVSRKIDNTIYVVSYQPQGYYYSGWSAPTTVPTEQAWVYSFDVSDPKAPRKVNELKLFEGGSVQFSNSGTSYSKYFNGVTLSATSNALMVVENWYVYASSYGSSGYGCGAYESNQRAVVSMVDISDPKGTIRLHTRFETNGTVSDQFKMTYVYDDQAKTGTFYGIFGRSVWSTAGCVGTSFTQNSLESWDVTNGASPALQARLDFGKPNESVRGTAFDVTRKVAYAITAQRIDPLYALSFADPKDLKILSAVDGLSGDMSVFRLISDGNFLVAVGTDTSATCSGFDATRGTQGSNIAVSIIDVRDLAKVRLVQRQCVQVTGSTFGTGSAITSNLDQAHKMIGMYSDAQANVITVPVYYYTKSDVTDWWWYRYQTAVGIMSWDLTKYDDTKSETQQTVLQNFGTFTHPNGEVRRTILYTHPVTLRRSMINLSDTHASLADIQDLAKPVQQSIIEIAPYYSELYRFGDYLVEHVQPKASTYQEPHEFRVRKVTTGALGDVVASFTVGQVTNVVKQGSNLVLFGTISKTPYAVSERTALVYDLSNPASPRKGGQVALPTITFPYYYYYCGWAPWAGYWFGNTTNWIATDRGLHFLQQTTNYATTGYTTSVSLNTLDLKDPSAPTLSTQTVGTYPYSYYYYSSQGVFSLVADAADPSSFYVTYRTSLGDVTRNAVQFTQYKHYAQRWQFTSSAPTANETINLPGPLVNTWKDASGARRFLTRESLYTVNTMAPYYYYSYQYDTRIALLRQTTKDGVPVAELQDTTTLTGLNPQALVREGDILLLTAQPSAYTGTWEQTSSRLLIYDLANSGLSPTYDQPTKASNLRIMAAQGTRAFLNLQGDGIVVMDFSKPTAPIGTLFLRTLGYATHLESFGEDIFVASGFFGLEHLNAKDPPNLAQQ